MFKTLTLSLAALAASASIAAADSYLLPFNMDQTASSRIELGTVRAASDGVIEIRSYNTGQVGALLGETKVRAGANSDVFVDTGSTPVTDVIALLKVNGQVVDSQPIELN